MMKMVVCHSCHDVDWDKKDIDREIKADIDSNNDTDGNADTDGNNKAAISGHDDTDGNDKVVIDGNNDIDDNDDTDGNHKAAIDGNDDIAHNNDDSSDCNDDNNDGGDVLSQFVLMCSFNATGELVVTTSFDGVLLVLDGRPSKHFDVLGFIGK